MKKVLIIEDEKPLRDAFCFLLKSEGFAIEQAENGKVGLEKLKAWKPDVVLLDVLMPVMNGLEFLKKAKLAKRYPRLKTLMLSNLSDPITVDDVRTYGVTDVVLKAELSPMELVAVVRKLLTSSRQTEGAPA